MNTRPLPVLLLIVFGTTSIAISQASARSLDSARRDISRLRYEEAQEKLIDIARSSEGEEKQEAMFLLAGLKRSAAEAEYIYHELISVDRDSDWAKRARIELAKIQYALGNYNQALMMLRGSAACAAFDEACYFQGLSAVMLKRFDEAKSNLSRVNRGKLGQWAYLSLAEVEMELQNTEEACSKYKAMAQALVSPTAMYRYGECLETRGDTPEAVRAFQQLIEKFRDTPEAVLAAQKLSILTKEPEEQPEPAEESVEEPMLSSGFTIQFGSFYDRRNAITLAARLKRVLPGVRIDSNVLHSREIHRVRYGYFATREEAEARAREMSGRIDDEYAIMTLP